jgi:hypothetical protein
VFDEPPEPADPTVVLDEPLMLDEVAVLDEPVVLDEVAMLGEPPPHAADSSTMPTVTASTPARRGAAPDQRERPPALSLIVWSLRLAE